MRINKDRVHFFLDDANWFLCFFFTLHGTQTPQI